MAVKKGFPATSLDELPRPLISALPGFSLRFLVGVVEALASGTPNCLLSVVLHLCLAKKLPAWLVHNSRPVMLEPYLRQLETGVVQDRRVTRRELRRVVPPEHFAYRRQLSGQTLALACRWLLAGWATHHGAVWSDNWDEANAFCNPDREAAGAWDPEAPEESPLSWLHNFYNGLDVWAASPYGPRGPLQAAPRRGLGRQPEGGRNGQSTSATRFARACTPRTGNVARRTRRPTSRGSPPPPMACSPRPP